MAQLRPRDVLAMHLDITEMIGDGNGAFGRYLDVLARYDYQITSKGNIGPIIARGLKQARAYVVTEKMTRFVMNRAEQMSGLEQLGSDDLTPPHPAGFVVLEEPISFVEVRGRTQIIHALAWAPALGVQTGTLTKDSGWAVSLFNDMGRQADDIAKSYVGDVSVRRSIGRWHGITSYWLPRQMRVGPSVVHPTEEKAAAVRADGAVPQPTRNIVRDVVSLWFTLNETISVHTSPHLDRKIVRLAARRKLPTEVTVITMRREAPPVLRPGTGAPLEYRTFVDTFRRRYWVGHGAEKHQEWRNVTPHWRGPADAPVLQRPKVNRLSR